MRLSSTRVSISSKTTGSAATPPDDVSPTFVSAATNTAGTLVILTYNEALSSTTAATSAFAVTRAGSANAVTAVAVSGSTVELTVTDTIETGQAITVAYTDPSGSDDANAIQDTAGNDAATLGSTSVTNNSTVASTAFNAAVFNGRYHKRGTSNDMGSFTVYWESGGNHTLLFHSSAGVTHSTNSAAWTAFDSGTILHNKDGETGNIVVVGYRKGGAKSDMALCELEITTQNGTTDLDIYPSGWNATRTSAGNSTLAKAASTPYALEDHASSNARWAYVGDARISGSNRFTPSTGTGPDKHHDDNVNSPYLYLEASNMNNYVYHTVRTASTITL